MLITKSELINLCQNWDQAHSSFYNIVSKSLKLFGKPFAIKLSEEFECMKTTPERWANETAKPHPRIEKLIIDYIMNYAINSND